MDIDDILKMTPEEFANAWNNDRNDVISTCYDALGITLITEETTEDQT